LSTPAVQPAKFELVRFDRSHAAKAADIAALHTESLSHSPVALLGDEFMERFYYSVLPSLDLIFGAIAYVDDKPAGFIVATADAKGFMRTGILKAWGRLTWTMFVSVVKRPSRLAAIWEALSIMKGVETGLPGPAHGELLSFAVLKPYRERAFIARTGIRISNELMRAAFEALTIRKVRACRAIVDADNTEARLFYLGHGWQPGLAKVPGWRKHTVEFIWQPPTEGGQSEAT
jgi:ribosomal protein S18 acetylase RimI-like enzyme